jgi:hypothetical protein
MVTKTIKSIKKKKTAKESGRMTSKGGVTKLLMKKNAMAGPNDKKPSVMSKTPAQPKRKK